LKGRSRKARAMIASLTFELESVKLLELKPSKAGIESAFTRCEARSDQKGLRRKRLEN
jgi:hypothetical protein